MKLIFLSLAAILIFVVCDPSTPPIWPNQFEQSFTETFTYPVIGSSSTKGKFYYDFLNKRYRIDRDNGKWDRYCATEYPFRNTACSQIVVDGKRYLHYPEKNYCCYCCDSAHGCGILKPDWLTGAKFIGYETEANGASYEKWDQQGLQHNYYYATNDSNRVMYKIDQQQNDLQTS